MFWELHFLFALPNMGYILEVFFLGTYHVMLPTMQAMRRSEWRSLRSMVGYCDGVAYSWGSSFLSEGVLGCLGVGDIGCA